MQRVLVIGSSGAGKSTFARALGGRLGLPLIHLDQHYWQPGWVPMEEARWREHVAGLVKPERWIIEGSYSSTFHLRMPRADTIIWLDLPRLLCLWSIVKRWLRHRGRETRLDMAEGCPEKIDWEFIRFVWTFPERTNPKTEAALRDHGAHAKLIRLTSRRAMADFLARAAAA